jgi:hypothetical protein
MRSKLPGHFYSALEIKAPLRGKALYATVFEQVEFYNLQFEMVFPPLNYPLLLFKHMRDLGVPGKWSLILFITLVNHSKSRYIQLFAVWRLCSSWISRFRYYTRGHMVFLRIQRSSL